MTAQLANGIDENTLYTATITFRSKGNSIQVLPESSYSHTFPDDYEGDYPAAFLCVRDINISLARMTQLFAGQESEDMEIDWLEEEVPEEDQAAAIAEYAKKVTLH